GDRLHAVGGGLRVVAEARGQAGVRGANLRIVVDDQDAAAGGLHDSAFSTAARSASSSNGFSSVSTAPSRPAEPRSRLLSNVPPPDMAIAGTLRPPRERAVMISIPSTS